jgi:putative transposase
MARLPRLSLAAYPHHVYQSGNNGQPIFLSDADRQFMLDLLGEQARSQGIALHAYTLLPDRFHLLLTPATSEGLARFMQAVGRRYVRYFNDHYGRHGTLWSGRYRSTVVDPQGQLLDCMAYLDLQAVHAGLVSQAREFPWSSHGHYIGARQDRYVVPPSLYWGLGNTPFAREAAYASRVSEGLAPARYQTLADAVRTGWVSGDAAFLADVRKKTERRLSKARAGRPPRAPHS